MTIPIGAEAGVTLLSVAISAALIVVFALAFQQILSSSSDTGAKIKRRTIGEQVLAGIAIGLQDQQFSVVDGLCRELGAFPATPSAPAPTLSQCKNAQGALAPQASGALARKLGVGHWLNNNGAVQADGKVCVDVVSCQWRAGKNSIELVLSAHWLPNPNRPQQIANRNLQVRKTR